VNLERNQASGVNVDEEQIDLVKFQSAYQAASKLVSVADDILKTLLDTLLR
jgi:flagellar hook-associated protein 1 FlgK